MKFLVGAVLGVMATVFALGTAPFDAQPQSLPSSPYELHQQEIPFTYMIYNNGHVCALMTHYTEKQLAYFNRCNQREARAQP